MLSDKKLKEVVERLANKEFVNAECFSYGEREQILLEWRKHPKYGT